MRRRINRFALNIQSGQRADNVRYWITQARGAHRRFISAKRAWTAHRGVSDALKADHERQERDTALRIARRWKAGK